RGGYANQRGATPTIVKGRPSRVTDRPATDGSASNCWRHNASAITTAFGEPGWSSPLDRVRPSATGTPRVSKKLPETVLEGICTGSPAPVSVMPPIAFAIAATASTLLAL